jgi:hypothetical protein
MWVTGKDTFEDDLEHVEDFGVGVQDARHHLR